MSMLRDGERYIFNWSPDYPSHPSVIYDGSLDERE